MARLGLAWRDTARQGKARRSRFGMAGSNAAGHGVARRSWFGEAWHDMAWCSVAKPGEAVAVRLAIGVARRGLARLGKAVEARPGRDGSGEARFGGRGRVGRGKAR